MYIIRNFTSRLRLLAISAGLAALGGCEQDLFQAPIAPEECHDGQISVLYEVEGDIPLTRGIAALEHEKSLRQVHILYFDKEEEKYVGCTKAQPSEASSSVKFDPADGVEPNKQYRLLVVGNPGMYDGTAASYNSYIESLTADDTYSGVRGELMAYSDQSVTNPENLPLCGRFVNPKTDSEIYFTYTCDPEKGIQFSYREGESLFRFQRAICRVDIHNLVANVLDIRYVRLVNTKDRGYYFFDGLTPSTYHELKFGKDAKSPGFIELPEKGDVEKLQRLEAKLYCFPNTVNTCLPNDQKTTAVMIAGIYTDPDTGVKDDVLTYYRFNISNAGEAQSLQRNYCYRATIKGVNRRGKEDEQEAYNETSPVFKYDIGEEWNTDDDNVVTDEHGNFLVVSKSLLTFSGDQSGADVVKLTVHTSEGMDWRIEMDDESKKHFQARKIDGAPGEKIQAFTCGPTQVNHTEYYYEGSIQIVAENKITGSVLRKEVRLVQLTTSGDVKCLVVNDYTSSFAQEVSKYGQTISYKVITGNPTNQWRAKDVNSTLNGWSDNVTFTESGTNGNYFTITFPANIGEKRSVDIEFRFDCEDEEANKLVKPITVTFTQDFCEQPLTIQGWPSDGELTLNCFDTRTGWETANCVAQSKRFTVNLQKPDDHYFVVSSTFDKYRDLTLSDFDCRLNNGHDVRSIHPGVFNQTSASFYLVSNEPEQVDETKYSNKLIKTSNDPTFYINAYRMGPGDTTIEGKITVQVKDSKTNEDIPNGKLELTVKLMVPTDEFMLNDVMIRNNRKDKSTSGDFGWIYIMDRNFGCDARMLKENEKTYPNKAMWCCYSQSEKNTDNWIITGMKNNEKWLGNITDYPIGGTGNTAGGNETDINSWKNVMMSTYDHLGPMYAKANEYPWLPMTTYTLPSIRMNTAISKSRYFILADESLCPENSEGKKIRVACWLPSGVEVCYGFILNYSDSFKDYLACMPNSSTLTEDLFWPNIYGHAWTTTGTNWLHLIRLMYMIGHPDLNSNSSLSADQIDEQIDYYKNHILKCYEAQ